MILNHIKKGQVFGQVIGWAYVIEYQKRGLPHAHLLIWLHPNDVPRTPEEIDKHISSEVPDPCINAELHEKVKEHMLHRVSM